MEQLPSLPDYVDNMVTESLDQERAERAKRAVGTAWEIIYQPRRAPPKPTKAQLRQQAALAKQAKVRAERRAKTKLIGTAQITLPGSLPSKILKDNTGSKFCVAIPKQADNDKQRVIRAVSI